MITIIGEGVWGTALSTLFKQNKQEFVFWDKHKEKRGFCQENMGVSGPLKEAVNSNE